MAPSGDVIAFLRAVFATGRLTLAEAQRGAAELTLSNATQTEWFLTDLPEGAEAMNANARAKSEQRQASPQLNALRDALLQIAGPPPAP